MLYNIEQILIKNNAAHYIRIMKEYTRDIKVIVSNMFTYIDVKSRLYMFIWNTQKRRMLFIIEQIKIMQHTTYTLWKNIPGISRS